MVREASQEQGREGARIAQRWLEATTFIELPLNAYQHSIQTLVDCLGGQEKGFDLTGNLLNKQMTPVSVECKNVTTDSHLREQYDEFLAVAYSATAHACDMNRDKGREFIWVSWHAFGPMTRWAHRETADEIRKALDAYPDMLAGEEVQPQLLSLTSSRVSAFTFNPKQERLTMSAREVEKVNLILKRKKRTL